MSNESDGAGGGGVTRRQFLTSLGTLGISAAAMAAPGGLGAEPPAEPAAEGSMTVPAHEMVPITLLINGRNHRLLVEPRWSLLYVLRERLGFTGTKEGCSRGECGACTVLIDDLPRYACMTLAVEAEGARIATVEGLMKGEQLGPVQQAFLENDAFQCGYCTPGQIMAVEGLLRATPSPTGEQIRRGVSGNLCRCGAYAHIFKAAQLAAQLKRGG